MNGKISQEKVNEHTFPKSKKSQIKWSKEDLHV